MFKLFPNPLFVPALGLSEVEGTLFRMIQEDLIIVHSVFRIEHSESNLIPGFYKLCSSASWAEPIIQHVRDGEPYGSLIQLTKEQAQLTIVKL